VKGIRPIRVQTAKPAKKRNGKNENSNFTLGEMAHLPMPKNDSGRSSVSGNNKSVE